ncbi:MAG: class 1 fructose-bisphosphatase [Ignavibacteriales bacterium]|nr:class 1 fructose-bisphosphatase [Ignavibacteriales bacterium]
MSQKKIVTIERHIIEEERAHPGASGDFSGLLRDLTLAFKVIWREVSKAGLVNILGFAGKENVHGEQVKKLDVFADETIYKALDHGGHLCVMASEENEDVLHIPEHYPTGRYVLLYDPLDGSSNIDANVTIGTIFSIFRRVTPSGKGSMADCLQPGYKQVAAGYVIYGSSTMLVYTTGDGVHGFTLDPSIGEFLLSHENIRIPKRGKIYSVNEGNYRWWFDGMKKYVKYLQEEDKATGRPYSGRYIGSLVGDIHRTMLYGGIFMYPGDTRNPDGKLRVMYEGNPMAFLVEQAGGRASNGTQRILDIQPKLLHQRTPIFIGSEEDVKIAEEFIQGKRDLQRSAAS